MIPILSSIFTGPDLAPNGMLYDLPLQPVGIALGLMLLVGHLAALAGEKPIRSLLPKFPRSAIAGQLLLALAAVWTLIIVWRIDLGEIQPHRSTLMMVVPVLYIFALWQMQEVLAVRALGMLLLLAANPVLDAAFLRPQPSRLLLPILAYGWILAGLFWVGMPWLLRDQIDWVVKTSLRYKSVCLLGVLYGLAILIAAFLFY